MIINDDNREFECLQDSEDNGETEVLICAMEKYQAMVNDLRASCRKEYRSFELTQQELRYLEKLRSDGTLEYEEFPPRLGRPRCKTPDEYVHPNSKYVRDYLDRKKEAPTVENIRRLSKELRRIRMAIDEYNLEVTKFNNRFAALNYVDRDDTAGFPRMTPVETLELMRVRRARAAADIKARDQRIRAAAIASREKREQEEAMDGLQAAREHFEIRKSTSPAVAHEAQDNLLDFGDLSPEEQDDLLKKLDF